MTGIGRSVHDAVDGGTGCNGGSCQAIVVHLGLAEDAVSTSSSRCSAVIVRLVVRPLRAAQVSGIQCRIQGKEGLDQWSLRP